MKTKFTKGQWQQRNDSTSIIIETEETIIATLEHWTNGYEIKANAKLIQAAPDLIEALERIKSMCDGNITNENNIWHIANMAIKKAIE